jgi:hypothetical protein
MMPSPKRQDQAENHMYRQQEAGGITACRELSSIVWQNRGELNGAQQEMRCWNQEETRDEGLLHFRTLVGIKNRL